MPKIINLVRSSLALLSLSAFGCEIHLDAKDGAGQVEPSPREEPSSEPWSTCPDCEAQPQPEPDWGAPGEPATDEQSLDVDRFKSLMIVDPSVLADARARSDVDGAPWSFRTQLEWLAGSSQHAPKLARDWLEQWATLSAVGPARAPVAPRPAVRELMIAPWQAAVADDYDTSTPLDLREAPFRLLAIVDRSDLKSGVCAGAAGQLRFVYGAVDATTGLPLAMTVIIELLLPDSRTPQGWARAFRELSDLDYGEGFNAALEKLTREVLRRASRDTTRVRTNEVALGEASGLPWELREFRLQAAESEPALLQVPLESTPRAGLSAGVVGAHVLAESDAALLGNLVFPIELRAGAAAIPSRDFRWQALQLDEPLQTAFSRGTCNGCHGGDSEALPFQHVAVDPQAPSRTKLSRFLHAPDRGSDELGRREQLLLEALTTECDGTPSYPGN